MKGPREHHWKWDKIKCEIFDAENADTARRVATVEGKGSASRAKLELTLRYGHTARFRFGQVILRSVTAGVDVLPCVAISLFLYLQSYNLGDAKGY